MGLYTPTILSGNSYLSWFYDRGAIKDPAHTGTSKGLSQAINRGPIRKFLPKYANVYVTIQSHGLGAGAWTHYVTGNGVRDGRPPWHPECEGRPWRDVVPGLGRPAEVYGVRDPGSNYLGSEARGRLYFSTRFTYKQV